MSYTVITDLDLFEYNNAFFFLTLKTNIVLNVKF